MPWIIRITDTSNHGGNVITGSGKWKCMDQQISRIGDLLACAVHGINPIIEGSPKYQCDDSPVAREGDHTLCQAALISFQNTWDMD